MPKDKFLVSKMPDIMRGIWNEIERGYHTFRNTPSADYASLSVFVLSHGSTDEHGVEYFEDSQKDKIPYPQFKALFYNGARPRNFRGRPIILYMQTCRGLEINQLLDVPLSSYQGDARKHRLSEDSLGHDGGEVKRLKTEEGVGGGVGRPPNSKKQLEGNPRVPDKDDVYVLKATMEMTKAYKKKATGSFFIQSVCDVLRDKPHIEFYDFAMALRKSMESKAESIGVDKGGLVPMVEWTPKKKFRYVKRDRKEDSGANLGKMWAEEDDQISSQHIDFGVQERGESLAQPIEDSKEEEEEINNQSAQAAIVEKGGEMEVDQ